MSKRKTTAPVPIEPAHYKRERGSCKHISPCGHECAMDARHAHQYHSCSRLECTHCHGAQRFQKGSA